MPIRAVKLNQPIASALGIKKDVPLYLIYEIENSSCKPRPLGVVTFKLTENGFHLSEVMHLSYIPCGIGVEGLLNDNVVIDLSSVIVNKIENIVEMAALECNTNQYYSKIGFVADAVLKSIPKGYAEGTVDIDCSGIDFGSLTSMISAQPPTVTLEKV